MGFPASPLPLGSAPASHGTMQTPERESAGLVASACLRCIWRLLQGLCEEDTPSPGLKRAWLHGSSWGQGQGCQGGEKTEKGSAFEKCLLATHQDVPALSPTVALNYSSAFTEAQQAGSCHLSRTDCPQGNLKFTTSILNTPTHFGKGQQSAPSLPTSPDWLSPAQWALWLLGPSCCALFLCSLIIRTGMYSRSPAGWHRGGTDTLAQH